MIEIVFSQSACGSLKLAQGYGKGKYPGGASSIGIIGSSDAPLTRKEIRKAQLLAEQRERLAWEHATPMNGKPDDVYCFSLALSMGDISDCLSDACRSPVLKRIYDVFPNKNNAVTIQQLLQKARQDLNHICNRFNAGEAIRVWYSNQPDELCGLYWLMTQLLEAASENCGPCYVVELPAWKADENQTITAHTSWAEVPPGEWHSYIDFQQPLPFPAFLTSCASVWKTLQSENAPLRAVISGRLLSVPDTFYDDFILCEIAKEAETFHEGRLIGKILGNYPLGISDAWISLRINEMIRRQILAIEVPAEKGQPAYHQILKKMRI